MRVQSVSFGILKKLNKSGKTYKDFELRSKTTFDIGGRAKYFVEISTLEDLIKVMLYLKKSDAKFFVLGGGSNIVVSSSGYSGVVISLIGDFDRIEQNFDCYEMGAGVRLAKAIRFCKENSLTGLEDSIGIPATIGGATYMNASCYGFEMSKLIDYVVAFDFIQQKIVYLTNSDCKFGYRSSVFQNKNYVILRVGLVLSPSDTESIKNRLIETLKKRQSSQPKGHSAGCVFKRIMGMQVSKMLDDMGAKGLNCNDAYVSDKHANFIINKANASSQDVRNLVDKLSKKFKEVYGIKLECEIEFIGE